MALPLEHVGRPGPASPPTSPSVTTPWYWHVARRRGSTDRGAPTARARRSRRAGASRDARREDRGTRRRSSDTRSRYSSAASACQRALVRRRAAPTPSTSGLRAVGRRERGNRDRREVRDGERRRAASGIAATAAVAQTSPSRLRTSICRHVARPVAEDLDVLAVVDGRREPRRDRPRLEPRPAPLARRGPRQVAVDRHAGDEATREPELLGDGVVVDLVLRVTASFRADQPWASRDLLADRGVVGLPNTKQSPVP